MRFRDSRTSRTLAALISAAKADFELDEVAEELPRELADIEALRIAAENVEDMELALVPRHSILLSILKAGQDLDFRLRNRLDERCATSS